MKNYIAITEASAQLKCAAERIGTLSSALEIASQNKNDKSFDDYEEMRLQELEQAQKLVLIVTNLIAEETEAGHNDDAFFQGELTDVLGEREAEATEETEDDDEESEN